MTDRVRHDGQYGAGNGVYVLDLVHKTSLFKFFIPCFLFNIKRISNKKRKLNQKKDL
jgi:hypothetical protein